ncbi:MAG TPA: serine/threonine-protein kinase [Sandaracinaceae bacterium LLY-WYZ-13_1]|nr:serine/threonine-protein kinase [Sandaracinaceae bacterium LLY-WYZ-13_1]
MGAPADSEPSLTASGEMGGAAAAGLGPGQRNVVAGRYRLLEHIAEGGMGSVFVAEHTLSRKKLALKVVHPYLCKGRQGVERFRREVSAAAEIDHPGIVQVYDAGVDDDGGFFMAMELLEGESLGDLLRRQWPGMATAVRLVEEMLEPLAKAHEKQFVHRDLKPDNIFLAVDPEGRQRVKLLDFGLAREVTKGGPTRTGVTFGTPEYMSPEQAMSARKVRAPGDVWSVGVMLYELLSGQHPFTGETPNAIMVNAIKEPLPPLREVAPHVPVPLALVIERCLQKDEDDRPQTAGEMLDELRRAIEGLTLDGTVPEAPTPPPTWSSDEEDPGIAVSSSFPVEPSRRQVAIETELIDRDGDQAPVATPSSAPGGSGRKRGLVLVAAAVGMLGIAAVIGAQIYWAIAGEDEPEMVATELAGAGAETGAPSAPEGAPPASEPVTPAAGADDGSEERAAGDEEVAADVGATETAEAPTEAAADDEGASDEASESADGAGEASVAARARARRAAARRREARQAAEDPEGPSALDEARECMARGDRSCARQVLEARARSAPEHAMLIGIYRESGQHSRMLDAMERFVRRFRRAPQTSEYREVLRRAGR